MKKVRPNNSESIYQSEKDKMDWIEKQKQFIRKNIEYDFLLQYSNYGHKELVKELYQLICDVVCVPRKTIRIGGCNIFYEIAKSQFLKLNRSHLEYVMEQLEENTSKIINIKSYLLTALYNAPLTIHSYFRQKVQHDMYSGLI